MTLITFAGGGTGGHLYPGLAIARALVRLEPSVQPFFIGARRGIERDVLPGTEFPHELLDLHPLYRRRIWNNWRTLWGLRSAWRRIDQLARADRPRLVVGTGGYAAGAMLAYANAHRIPFVLQEQNSHPGATVRFFAKMAREIYLGFPEAATMLRHPRRVTVVDTGNPIEPPPIQRPNVAEARARWGLESGGRVILVFGGSQGSRAINDAVAAWIDAGLPDETRVLWATGKNNDAAYARFDGARVRVVPYISPMRDAYAVADLAIARAGAMGTAELCAWGIPQLLIPLPTAAADHQSKNAAALATAGAAHVVRQAELSGATLGAAIGELLHSPARLQSMAAAALARGRPDAADVIARRILKLANDD